MPAATLLTLALAIASGLAPRGASAATVVRVVDSRITLADRASRGVATIRRAPFRLAVRGLGGRRLLSEPVDGGLFYEGADGLRHRLRTVSQAAKLDDGVQLTVATDDDRSATVTVRWVADGTLSVVLDPPDPASVVAMGERLRSPSREAIYGLTERLRDSPPLADGVIDIPQDDIAPPEVGSLNRRGETVAMYVRPTFALYAPFFVSSLGYGLGVSGTTVGEFDLAKTAPDVVSFRFETGLLPEHRRFAFDVFVGPSHAQILDRYTARNGRPLVPPDWAFGHWRWRDELAVGNTGTVDGVTVQGQVATDLERYDALGLPAGIWLFDRPTLSGEYGFARFAWNPDQLPNQQQILQSMRQRGWRIVTWSSTWTCGSTAGDHGLEAQGLGYHLPRPLGTPHCADVGGTSFILDLTHPDAGGWWQQKVATFVTGESINGIKLDRGEEHLPSLATDIWHDGRSGREGRNAYPTLQARVHNQALRQAHPDDDFVLITRAGYTGTAQYAIAWGGDIPGSEAFGNGTGTDLGLRSAIISQQRAAFMGYPIWGSDTGGYYEYKDGTVDGRAILGREVFARWLQFSTFSGIMEIGGKGSHAPWAMPSAPVDDSELTAIYARYVKLREALRPYILSLLPAAARGTPLVRPLPFEFSTDPRARDRWDEYLFGPSLLVAPVWRSGDRQREVYFPKGRWRSYWDASQVIRGPKTLTVDAPLDEIPVYVRKGAPAVPNPE